jgi:hypothetical protein
VPGRYELRIRTEGYERGALRYLIEPGVENDLGDIALEKGQWVQGIVVDELEQGLPCALTCDRVDPLTGRVLPSASTYLYGTEADGSFRIGALSRATYRLALDQKDTWGATAWYVDARSGPVEGLRLQAARGVPLVLHPSVADPFGMSFELFDARGTSLLSQRHASFEPQKLLLAPGDYEIEVRAAGQPAARKAFTIESTPVVLSIP